jgi:hypothetical protein
MSAADEPPETLSPAERRLGDHLALLRTEAPQPPGTMVSTILHNARWQRALRRPLLTIAALAASVAEGVRLLLGSTRNGS